jgi:hypothetical protein
MNTIAQEWIQLGIEQGREQGKEIGELQATRENVLRLLELRFGKVTAHTVTVLAQIDDLAQMKALFQHAATEESLTAFEEALPT